MLGPPAMLWCIASTRSVTPLVASTARRVAPRRSSMAVRAVFGVRWWAGIGVTIPSNAHGDMRQRGAFQPPNASTGKRTTRRAEIQIALRGVNGLTVVRERPDAGRRVVTGQVEIVFTERIR